MRRRTSAAWLSAFLLGLSMFVIATIVAAQSKPRDASYAWDEAKKRVHATLSFRDVMDSDIKKKADQGFPTIVVLTATVHRPGTADPVASTLQTCKITWHVWEEAYLVELTQQGGTRQQIWAVAWKGVLRHCGEALRLVAADATQLPIGAPMYLLVKVQVNPASPELLQKIKRWRSQPSATGTAAPGDALFSTFTGLFLAPIGEADKSVEFSTKSAVPSVPKKKQ